MVPGIEKGMVVKENINEENLSLPCPYENILRSSSVHKKLVQAPKEHLIWIFDGAGFSNMWN